VAEAQSRLRDYFPDYGSRGSLTDAPAETPRTALLEQYGSIVEPYEPSLSERIYNFAFDALGGNTATGLDRQRIQRWAGYPQKIIDQTALAGITDYSQAMQDYARGDALSGTTNLAMAATSLIPGQQRQAAEEISNRLLKGTFGRTLDTSNIQIPLRPPQTDVPQIPFRSDTPAQSVSQPTKSYVSWDTMADEIPEYDEYGQFVDTVTGPEYAVIEKVYVDPSERGQGKARSMLRDTVAEIQSNNPGMPVRLNALSLEPETDLDRLVSFYEGEGFSEMPASEGMDFIPMELTGTPRQSVPDTPAQGQSALRNLTDAPASALSGNYTDRIVQEYPKSYNPIIIDNYVNQGVDPRTFTAGSGSKSSDPRVGQMSILGGTNINIGDPRMGQVKEIDLGDYEGYPFFTSMSDRAAAGDVILDINGVPINVSRRGGQNYMFDPESGEFVWASDKGVVLKSKGKELSDTSFFKTAQDLKKTYGKDPLIIPWTMAPTGIDFSTQIGETMLSYAKNAMSRADLKSLDKDVKNIIPEWKGIDSPDWTVSFRNTTGNQRKAVSDLLDKKYVDKGGITSGIARYANTDVDLRMARDGQVMNVGMVDTDRYPVTDNRIVHPTYDTGLYGEGVGRIGGDVQVFELLPTARQLMGISDPLNPARSALRALEMKPYSGIITESTLRAIEDRRR